MLGAWPPHAQPRAHKYTLVASVPTHHGVVKSFGFAFPAREAVAAFTASVQLHFQYERGPRRPRSSYLMKNR